VVVAIRFPTTCTRGRTVLVVAALVVCLAVHVVRVAGFVDSGTTTSNGSSRLRVFGGSSSPLP